MYDNEIDVLLEEINILSDSIEMVSLNEAVDVKSKLETVKKVLKALWEKFVEFVKKIVDKVKYIKAKVDFKKVKFPDDVEVDTYENIDKVGVKINSDTDENISTDEQMEDIFGKKVTRKLSDIDFDKILDNIDWYENMSKDIDLVEEQAQIMIKYNKDKSEIESNEYVLSAKKRILFYTKALAEHNKLINIAARYTDIKKPEAQNESAVEILNEGIFFETEKGKEKLKNNLKTIESAIKNGLLMIEKFVPLVDKYLSDIDKAYDEKLIDVAKKFYSDAIKLDYDRGTDDELTKQSAAYIKLRMNKIFNRADYKSEEFSSELLEFIKKCSKNGEYANKIEKLYDIIRGIRDKIDKLDGKFTSNEQRQLLDVAKREYNFFTGQLGLYYSDIESLKMSHGKVMQKITQNESVSYASILNDTNLTSNQKVARLLLEAAELLG